MVIYIIGLNIISKQVKKKNYHQRLQKKDRRIGSDEEGRAEEYAFNNVYRKDRRDILKNSNYNLAELEKSNNELEKGPYVGLDKAADMYRKNPDKVNNIKKLLNNYSNKVYNAGRYNKAKNIVNILKSIEKERGNNK